MFSFCSTFYPLAVLPELGRCSFSFSDVVQPFQKEPCVSAEVMIYYLVQSFSINLFLTTAQPTCIDLFPMWLPMEPVGFKKFSRSTRETLWFSWNITLNYFPFTKLAAQLEADTGKCT